VTAAAPDRPPVAWRLIAALAALKLLLHLTTNLVTPFEFHRDEFLYFAMGDHLRLWRMDFPPFIAILARTVRAVAGDSLVAIRMVPALAGTALVVLAPLIAREMGGGRRAQGLAALAVIANVLMLRSANLFQPVVLDQLWWTLGLYALARLCREDRPRWWVLLGVAGGIGLLTKFSILFFGLAVLAALLATPHRRALLTPWPWLTLAIALVLGSPSLAGQVALHFPIVTQMEELRRGQLDRVSWVEFVGTQFLMFGPGVLLAAMGAARLLLRESLRPFRAVGWACVAAFVILLLLHGKAYYVGPIYPALFAAGAAGGAGMEHAARVRRRPVALWAAAMVAFTLLTLPIGLPLFSPAVTRAWIIRIGGRPALMNNRGEEERLPQDYGDMLGWERLVRRAAAVYDSLPPEKRARTVVWGASYGEAGALAFYGPRFGLPPAISDEGSFWFFGPGDRPGDVVLTVGSECEDFRGYYRRVTSAGTFDDPWMVGEQRNTPICVAEDPTRSLQSIWPVIRSNN